MQTSIFDTKHFVLIASFEKRIGKLSVFEYPETNTYEKDKLVN